MARMFTYHKDYAMKLAVLAAILLFSINAQATDQSRCNHVVERGPADVGYSVSARRAAEDPSVGQSIAAGSSASCGPSSVGYSVTARRAAAERENATDPNESYANSAFPRSGSTYISPRDYYADSGYASSPGKSGGRLGSRRVGGVGSSGKGGHYVGGRK